MIRRGFVIFSRTSCILPLRLHYFIFSLSAICHSVNVTSHPKEWSLAPILAQLVHLELLDFSRNDDIGSAGADSLCAALRNLPCPQSLNLYRCKIADAGFSSLASALSFLPQLTDLNISWMWRYPEPIDQGMIDLGRLLPSCHSLHTLSAGDNTYTPASMHTFFLALPLLPSLRVLDIHSLRQQER